MSLMGESRAAFGRKILLFRLDSRENFHFIKKAHFLKRLEDLCCLF